MSKQQKEDLRRLYNQTQERPTWLPSEAQIAAHVARQREERIRMARRVDDGPVTIMVERGYGPTPGFDKPLPPPPWYKRVWRKLWK